MFVPTDQILGQEWRRPCFLISIERIIDYIVSSRSKFEYEVSCISYTSPPI